MFREGEGALQSDPLVFTATAYHCGGIFSIALQLKARKSHARKYLLNS